MNKVNLAEKFSLFDAHWQPKVVGELNQQLVKLVKVKGEFVWHRHENEDEFFMVVKGHLKIKLRDGDIDLDPGEFYIVPRGIEHMPVAEAETQLLVFEPKNTLNTGNADSDRAVPELERI